MCCGGSTKRNTGADYRPPVKEVRKAKRELVKRNGRGHFVTLPKIKSAWRLSRGITIDDFHLSRKDVDSLYSPNNCPCGHCKFYNLEIYPEDRIFFLHHVSDGLFKMGTY